jgi:hypothetical protein
MRLVARAAASEVGVKQRTGTPRRIAEGADERLEDTRTK